MAISGSRMSTYTQISASSDRERPMSGESAKKDMWSSMLDSVASGKRLPEKNILVLGESAPMDSREMFADILHRRFIRLPERVSGSSILR